MYFTEQWTGANGTFNGDFQWHIENVIIGSMRNWEKWRWSGTWPATWPMAHTPGGAANAGRPLH